ncbi:hypothetical protein BaRGS_00040501, partial [Batillaria attramentaria]
HAISALRYLLRDGEWEPSEGEMHVHNVIKKHRGNEKTFSNTKIQANDMCTPKPPHHTLENSVHCTNKRMLTSELAASNVSSPNDGSSSFLLTGRSFPRLFFRTTSDLLLPRDETPRFPMTWQQAQPALQRRRSPAFLGGTSTSGKG